MLKSYLVSHSYSAGEWTQLAAYLDAETDIANWVYFLPNTFLVVTTLSARELADRLRGATPAGSHLLVMNTDTERWGWLTPEVWKLMGEPAAAPPQAPGFQKALADFARQR